VCVSSPNVALAGTIRMDVRAEPDGTNPTMLLLYQANPGERNVIYDSFIEDTEVVVLDEAGISAEPPCVVLNEPDVSPSASCPRPSADIPIDFRAFLGDGRDTAEFPDESATVLLEGGRGGDDLHDADVIRGGPGGDSLTHGETIYGEGGNDVIGLGERISGGPGDDYLRGSEGATRMFGGPGRDLLMGGRGPDTIWPGSGRDRIDALGDDDGGTARDFVYARGNTTDTIFCGRREARDVLIVDRFDFVGRCPLPDREGASVPVPLAFYPDEDDRGALLVIGCSTDGPPVCEGRMTVTSRRGRRLGSTDFRLRTAGGIKSYEINRNITDHALGRVVEVVVRVVTSDSAGRRRVLVRRLPVSN
jgi:hypothetical protein